MAYEAIDSPTQSTMAQKTADSLPQWPLTPPDPPPPTSSATNDIFSVVTTAIHVMSTERAALANLECLYQTDSRAQRDLARAVDLIARSVREAGKLVVCGVGKSGKIGRKIEATMNSLGVYSAFLHPTEALHGDLGLVRPNDTILLISFSGRSPELLSLLPHLPATVPVIALSSHTEPSACPLLSLHSPSGMGVLLPAPIHEDEEASLGVSAPTSSTTVAMCLGDALAIAVARKLHTAPGKGPADVFRSFHPGGAIGAAAAGGTPLTTPSSCVSSTTFDSPSSSVSLQWEDLNGSSSIPPFILQPPPENRRIPIEKLVPLDQIPLVSASTSDSPDDIRLLDILLAAIQHPNAKTWVLISPSRVIPPQRMRSLLSQHTNVDLRVSEVTAKDGRPLAVHQDNWLWVPEWSLLSDVRKLILASREGPNAYPIVAVSKDQTRSGCIGVLEAEELCGG